MCIYMAANALCTVGQEAIFNKILRKDIDKMKAEAAEREGRKRLSWPPARREIAERRRLQEEANKANKKGKEEGQEARFPPRNPPTRTAASASAPTRWAATMIPTATAAA